MLITKGVSYASVMKKNNQETKLKRLLVFKGCVKLIDLHRLALTWTDLTDIALKMQKYSALQKNSFFYSTLYKTTVASMVSKIPKRNVPRLKDLKWGFKVQFKIFQKLQGLTFLGWISKVVLFKQKDVKYSFLLQSY